VSTSLTFRAVAAVALVAFLAGCLAAVSQAQAPAPAPPQRTLVSAGTGQVRVTPKDRQDNASIAKAVDDADAKALPAAIADAKQEAQELATAAGVTLGTLLSISNTVAQPGYFGPYYGINGTFGPGRYCAQIRTVRFVKGKDGKRHRVTTPKHKVCRVPPFVTRQVQLTYALT
jgi:uncharacterized protein YggE